MIQFIRVLGFFFIAAGVVVLFTWVVKPLRAVWPWLLALPLPIRIGLIAAAAGFLLILASVIMERIADRDKDRDLLKD